MCVALPVVALVESADLPNRFDVAVHVSLEKTIQSKRFVY
jgi:hypothetical protein